MLEIGSQLLIGLPGPSKFRVLHMGCVTEIRDDGYTVEFEMIEEFPGETGSAARLFFHDGTDFVQQPAKIDTIVDDAPIPTVLVATLGDPVSAEGRQHPRISTVASELTATVGTEELCPIVDLSRTGFAVMSSETHELGGILQATIHDGDTKYTGDASIQSCKELWEGRYRYGLYCCDTSESGSLNTGLAKLSADLHAVVE